MAQRRHHAERAFEALLRAQRIPYVAVNEARKALLPDFSHHNHAGPGHAAQGAGSLKNFDFIVYGRASNLLIEVKGRTIPAPRSARAGGGRRECWVTLDDIHALRAWQGLFGPGYEAVFVFVYACDGTPPDGLFGEVLEHEGAWYSVRAVTLDEYVTRMRVRSEKWRTVDLARADFDRLSRPFASEGWCGPCPALERIG